MTISFLLFAIHKREEKWRHLFGSNSHFSGFLYMDRVFILTVHNFYLCFCSSLISLHSLRHISSQSICGTKPKRPILPASATGGHVSPRWNGVATLCFGAFLHVASQIWIQDGAQGASETKIDHFVFQFFFSFILCFSPIWSFWNWLTASSVFIAHRETIHRHCCVPSRQYCSVFLDSEDILAKVAFKHWHRKVVGEPARVST